MSEGIVLGSSFVPSPRRPALNARIKPSGYAASSGGDLPGFSE